MKIKAILDSAYDLTNPLEGTGLPDGDYGKERNTRYPELAQLLLARNANNLVNCTLMSRDELEFANFIINKLDIDPMYIPSMVLLDAIRSINAKLAIGRTVEAR